MMSLRAFSCLTLMAATLTACPQTRTRPPATSRPMASRPATSRPAATRSEAGISPRLPRAFARRGRQTAAESSALPPPPPPPPQLPVQRLVTPFGTLHRGKVLELKGLRFAIAKARLHPSSFKRLDGLVAALKRQPRATIEIRGHIGWQRRYYSYRLSHHRACAVRRYLIAKGIAATRLSCKGFGASQPLVPGRSRRARLRNRRVEIVLR